ncbi:MAG: cobyrinic acid a,c-diamide synthase, partial [Kiloniellales bacterium]|nr:cobyrinic acid a,c-diamide synthase [Kiloniellales bacterium]
LPPLGQNIAVARDLAFLFSYPALLKAWRQAGSAISFFSPLEDEAPDSDADAVYLPGGYPELHAGRISANDRFLTGLRAAAKRGSWIYGECGGYMVLGRGLEDAEGLRHSMAGLLPLETSFMTRHRNLGYRTATLLQESPFGQKGKAFRGHEFHYATILSGEGDNPLFACTNFQGVQMADQGCRSGKILGSFVHLIDQED